MQRMTARAELHRQYLTSLIDAHSFDYRGWKVAGVLMPARNGIYASVGVIPTPSLLDWALLDAPMAWFNHPVWGMTASFKIDGKHHSLAVARFVTNCEEGQRAEFKDIHEPGAKSRRFNPLDLTPDNVWAGSFSRRSIPEPRELLSKVPRQRSRTRLEDRLADPSRLNHYDPFTVHYRLK